MNIALLKVPNNEYSNNHRVHHVPLGLGYITSYLKMNGYNPQLIDADYMGLGYEETVDLIMQGNYDVVGITVIFRKTMVHIVEIINLLRKKSYKGKIILGGHYPSFDYQYIMKNYPEIDAILRFEGELTFYDLVKCLEIGEDIKNVPGIVCRDSVGIFVNPEVKYENDLDKLPFPERSFAYKEMKKNRYATMITSRGCYANCAFCSISTFYRAEKCTWRGRSGRNIVQEMKFLRERYGVATIDFLDDNIFGPGENGIKRLQDFCNELDNQDVKMTFTASARTCDGNLAIYQNLRNHGLVKVLFGIESGSEKTLDFFNKKLSVKQNIETIKMIYDNDIIPDIGFIFFHPYLQFEEIKLNLEFFRGISEYCIITLREIGSSLEVLSGSKIEKMMLENGDIIKEDFNIIKGYLYKIEDDKVQEFFNAICYILKNNSKVDVIVQSYFLGIWRWLIEIDYFYGIDLSHIKKTFHWLRKDNGNKILDMIKEICLEVDKYGSYDQKKLADSSNKLLEGEYKVLTALMYLKAELENIMLKVEGKNENKISMPSSFLN